MSDFRLIARVGVPALLAGVIAVAGVILGQPVPSRPRESMGAKVRSS
jgi:hypothetical protein